jgi:hypothetical protein
MRNECLERFKIVEDKWKKYIIDLSDNEKIHYKWLLKIRTLCDLFCAKNQQKVCSILNALNNRQI